MTVWLRPRHIPSCHRRSYIHFRTRPDGPLIPLQMIILFIIYRMHTSTLQCACTWRHWPSQAMWHWDARAPSTSISNDLFFFQFTLQLHKFSQQLCAVASPNTRVLILCNSSCGSSVAASVHHFVSFYVRQKFHVVLCPLPHTRFWRPHCMAPLSLS